MADIYSAQKAHKQQKNIPGQLIIKAHYKADDGSANMSYSFNCPSDVSRVKGDVWMTATNIYMCLENPIVMLDDMPELDLIKITVHEVFYDDDGTIKLDCLLDEFTY